MVSNNQRKSPPHCVGHLKTRLWLSKRARLEMGFVTKDYMPPVRVVPTLKEFSETLRMAIGNIPGFYKF